MQIQLMRNLLFCILLCLISETKMALKPIQIGRSIGLSLGLGAVWTLSAFYYEAINIGKKVGIGKKIGQLSVATRSATAISATAKMLM